MTTKKVLVSGKTYVLTTDAMLLFECQRELKFNFLEKIGELSNLKEDGDLEATQALCDFYAATALSLARCKDNHFESWQEALEKLSISEMQQLSIALIDAVSETNSKN